MSAAAPYRATEILDLSDVQVQKAGGPIAAQDNDGLHVVGYVGDTTGDGIYTTEDVTRGMRVANFQDSGLSAFPLIDPVVVGDINLDGKVSALDILLLRAEVAGTDRPEIPPVVVPAGDLTFATLEPASETPQPPPFALLFEPQALTTSSVMSASASASDSADSLEAAKRLTTPALPVINWKPATNATQPGSSYGSRPDWLKSFVSGNGKSGTTGLQPFSITL